MKLSHIALTILLSAATAFGVAQVAPAPQGQAASPQSKKETAFERVMRTNTLRCAYIVMPPQLTRDPNTGAFSGVSVDVMEEAAKRLGLKVTWAEEVTFASMAEGLKTGRYDAFCLAGYRWVPAARATEFTIPVYQSTTDAYVRADDHRFDADLKTIDNPDVKIVVSDGGEASAFIRASDFPRSTAFSLSANTDISLFAETVATRKADVTLANPLMIMPYLVANPDKLRRITGQTPIRIQSHAFSFNKGEHDLTSMFNVVIDEMHTDRSIDKILDKYEAIPNSFVRVKRPVSNP